MARPVLRPYHCPTRCLCRNSWLLLPLLYVVDGRVVRESVEDMVTTHEEADTMVCFHARCMHNSGEIGNIIVKASDINIAIILLYHSPTFTATLWMDTGRYINLTAVGKVMGPCASHSLPSTYSLVATIRLPLRGKERNDCLQNLKITRT